MVFVCSPRPALSHPASRYAPLLSTDSLPASFDWRSQDLKVVNPVRDQGTVGTCWAFSTVENIEGVHAKAGNPLAVLSVEQLVDW